MHADGGYGVSWNALDLELAFNNGDIDWARYTIELHEVECDLLDKFYMPVPCLDFGSKSRYWLKISISN